MGPKPGAIAIVVLNCSAKPVALMSGDSFQSSCLFRSTIRTLVSLTLPPTSVDDIV